jgi:hypothetical protein
MLLIQTAPSQVAIRNCSAVDAPPKAARPASGELASGFTSLNRAATGGGASMTIGVVVCHPEA